MKRLKKLELKNAAKKALPYLPVVNVPNEINNKIKISCEIVSTELMSGIAVHPVTGLMIMSNFVISVLKSSLFCVCACVS